jgi:hypothetical protein
MTGPNPAVSGPGLAGSDNHRHHGEETDRGVGWMRAVAVGRNARPAPPDRAFLKPKDLLN